MTTVLSAGARLIQADNNPFAKRGDWNGWWRAEGQADWENGALWPSTQILGGAVVTPPPLFEALPKFYGSQSMLKFRGITRDSTGAVLGSAVVQGFLTSTDQYLRQVTSDAGGYFELPSEYATTNHFLVAYKAGSPDVAGTSVNTIQPA